MGDIAKVLLGGVVVLLGTVGVRLWEEWRQRIALRAAFGAEIEGLLIIAELRGHVVNAKAWAARWKKGEDFVPKLFGTPPDEDPVFAKNVDKIGLLGSDAADVVLFYTLLKAIRVHLRALVGGSIKELAPAERAAFTEKGLELWARALPLAEGLVARLSPKKARRAAPPAA